MARFGKPTGICPVGADPKVAAAIVGTAASPFPTGYFVRFLSHAAIARLKACPVKNRVFGVPEVTIKPCVAPSAGISITECQPRAAIPTSLFITLLKGHDEIDRRFLRSTFRVHDDDASLTIDPDDPLQLRVAFSSLDKCKAFFQSEVVPDEERVADASDSSLARIVPIGFPHSTVRLTPHSPQPTPIPATDPATDSATGSS